jgi:hypothetical protein
MSDLSRLLDDVYEPAATEHGKGWTSDEALDNAFSNWVPGPSEDASETEKSLFAGAQAPATGVATDLVDGDSDDRSRPDPSDPGAGRDTSTSTPALEQTDPTGQEWASAVSTPAEDSTPTPAVWLPIDDDILPAQGSRRLFGRGRRR